MPFHHGIEADAGPQSLCVSCNACETVCPVEIPRPSLILDVRSRTVAAKGIPWLKRLIFGTMAHPRLFGLITRLASIGQFPVTRGSSFVRARNFGILGKLPGMHALVGQTRWRSFPAFATRPLRDRVKGLVQVSRGPVRGYLSPRQGFPARITETSQHRPLTVCYFAGCMTDRLFPEMGEAAIKVLEFYGVRVTFPRAQNCCGLPALNSGDRRDGAAMARQTIVALERALQENEADYVISASTSCVVTIIQDYIRLFEDLQQYGWLERTKALAEKVTDFTHFIDSVIFTSGVSLAQRSNNASQDVVVTYHDSCQSCNSLNLRPEARRIIQDVLGLELREMPQSDVCCGFGGSTSIEHPEVAKRLLNNKLNNAESTGATILVADNPGCLMHLRGGVDATGRKVRVLHLAQLIAEYLP